MGVETSKGISNQNTSLRGTSGPIEPGSASFSKLVETWESQPHLKHGLAVLVVISWLSNPRFTTRNDHCGPLLGSRQVGSSTEPKLSGIYA